MDTKLKKKRKSLIGYIGANWIDEWDRVVAFFEGEEELLISDKPLTKRDVKIMLIMKEI